MHVLLTVNDAEIFDLTKMPNIGKILDKAYKKSRQGMINEIAHDRAVFLSFDAWYMTMNEEQRAATMKNIRSTIAIDEIVPENLRNRDLVIEAITRIRENMTDETREDARVAPSEVDTERPDEGKSE
jgi:3-hydroxyacyl-CoA dehydrogenase